MRQENNLLVRQRAVDACLKRFAGQALRWGRTDCVKLTALALRKQGVSVPQLKGLRYRSALGAAKALEATGHDNLLAAMDATGLARIAPAAAWPGDIVGLPSDDDRFDVALTVCVSPGSTRLLSLDGAGRFGVIKPSSLFCGAWRVSNG
ncbi:MAG: hypothetical protein ACJA0Y_000192 [Maricaulis maris]|jgi:hypothetical protein